jgi:hypothetical protein
MEGSAAGYLRERIPEGSPKFAELKEHYIGTYIQWGFRIPEFLSAYALGTHSTQQTAETVKESAKLMQPMLLALNANQCDNTLAIKLFLQSYCIVTDTRHCGRRSHPFDSISITTREQSDAAVWLPRQHRPQIRANYQVQSFEFKSFELFDEWIAAVFYELPQR